MRMERWAQGMDTAEVAMTLGEGRTGPCSPTDTKGALAIVHGSQSYGSQSWRRDQCLLPEATCSQQCFALR